MSSNPAHDKVYSMQHYVMKFVTEQGSILGVIRSRQTNKYRQHNGLSKKGKNTKNVPQTLHVQSKLKIEKHEPH